MKYVPPYKLPPVTMPKSPFKKKTMNNKTPERSVEEIVEEFISENMNKTFIREKGRPKEDGYIIESYSILFKTALEQTLQAERQKREEMVVDIIRMADALEMECGKDSDKGTKQWMAFKGFRNTIRAKYLTQPNNPN